MALDPVAFKRYLDEKYPNQELNAIAYYETREIRDDFNRLVFPGGLKVDREFSIMHQFMFLSTETLQASLSLQSMSLVLMHRSTLLSVQATRL